MKLLGITLAVMFFTALGVLGQEAPFARVDPMLAPAQAPAAHLLGPDTGLEAQTLGPLTQPHIGKLQPLYQANDISLEGQLSAQISGSALTIHADRLANNRSSGVSGTLRISLWATTSPTSFGSSINGYRVGYYQFSSTLPAGYYFGPVDHNVSYTSAPPGQYYVTMTADEYSSTNNPSVNDGFSYHDLVPLDGMWTFGGGCAATDTTLCLNSRFVVSATWQTNDGNSGSGHAIPLTSDTGYFWFFGSSNVEMVIKVINGCAISQRYWVFAGGLTNVRVTISVRDVVTGTVRTYTNPMNTAFQPIQDTGAFATCQ